MKSNVQILQTKGKPAFAVVSIAEYRRLLELDEDAKDADARHRAAKRLGSGEEATVPADVVDRLLAGEPPTRI